uniref:Uncharacterized protein n=1 Tax=Halimeda discoidea TaxID=118222 RepID=A0A1C9JB29_9CHLO|nr:hypothetical protein [Halimeda discoidea]
MYVLGNFIYDKKIMTKLNSKSIQILRCDWLELNVSPKVYSLLRSSAWFKNFRPSAGFPDDNLYSLRMRLAQAQANKEHETDVIRPLIRRINEIQSFKELEKFAAYNGEIGPCAQWSKNGHSLLFQECKSPSRSDWTHISAYGRLGNQLLKELQNLTNLSGQNLQFTRIDIKKQISFSRDHRRLNWERIWKRQIEAEKLKSQYRRTVEYQTSIRGTTLALGSRGNKTYCRLEYINYNNDEASKGPFVSIELEYRQKQAQKIGYMLLKSDNFEKEIKNLLKAYLLSLEPIQNVTKKLLQNL